MPEVQTIPLTTELTPELRAYAKAMRDGFFESPPTEQGLAVWHSYLVQDNTRLRQIMDDDARPFGLQGQPVATFASWDGTINTGTGLAPTNFITDVTVQASHRRRGLMNQLMRTDLAEARERGDVFAVLTATDARIYGRFGFGVTATARRIEINTGSRFQLRTKPVGRTVFAETAEIAPVRRELFEKFHATQFLSVGRAAHYWGANFDWATQQPRDERAAVHFDEHGDPDATLVFVVEDDHLRIVDLLGLNPRAEIELLRLIGQAEGHEKVVWPRCHDPRHPLPFAMVDSRVVQTIKEFDTVWVRILDLEEAISRRAFDFDGEAVLAVRDPLGWCEGTYRISVTGGSATVSRTDVKADAAITMEGLSPLYSGIQDAEGLAAAGLIEGDHEGLARLSRLFGKARPPVAASIF
ncbi:GNAT family N-acetyltransferase [Tessaracoccus sp. OS52]|uniref:GNAT family N-acetyltransferase n=1 Tax=Tessaracoccus sp. OS52 TaxID=2886691 RepID=UPI001D1179DE|nr:GNAT family N-acetyltransferase [Tessaracoccus sp. OS52]MCC2592457.1 GNAT family N-acetyltransferase [Tessaracoccus sp. OS52]